jgi:hypothetical protein
MNEIKILTIIRRLARPGGKLVAADDKESGGADSSYILAVNCTASERQITVQGKVVRGWLADGLIEPCDGGYGLGEAGKSWLRRRLSAGDEFAIQHQARKVRIIDFEGDKRPAIVNDSESPLRWLASRKDKNGKSMLAAFQLEAGERLRADYQFAGLTAKVTSSWNPAAQGSSSGGSNNDATALMDNVMAARQRVVRAVAAVGPELAGILVDVCCHLKGLEEAEKNEGWPQRSGKVILQLALTRLARHYGLINDNQISEGLKRRLSHWGADDFRPKISAGGNPAS